MAASDAERQSKETDPLIRNRPAKEKVTPLQDAWDTIQLGFPIFLSMISWVGMRTIDTALLGHVSAEALSAASLSDVWTMCTGVLVQGRSLGILAGQAIGAGNPKLAGTYLQVSYLLLSVVAIFVIFAWNTTSVVWQALGQEEEVSKDAGYYSRILSLAIPGQVIVGQLSQFFAAQRIMYPEVFSSCVALTLNMIFGLIMVLGYPKQIYGIGGYGFEACPIVTVVVVYVQVLFLWYVFCIIKGLHKNAWGGWKWEDMTRARIKTFAKLYVPDALALTMDFWRMAVIGIVAARMGPDQVAVFNSSYRIMWMVLILEGALASAAGIKMSMRLGQGDPAGAKQVAMVGIVICGSILFVIASVVFINLKGLAHIFTDDPHFLELLDDATLPFVATLVFMNLSVALERIPLSMGRTTEVFWYGFIGSWCGQVPGVFICVTFWKKDLTGLYSGMAIGYLLVTGLYAHLTLTSDW
eukprot:CAMPEP_0118689444 /NCGR_PEP_ID=MMETSP0800-20121206/9495_1 /TAXON_ID=210618 ORGANISM="Striatella unipunctata, Strain CCMP2910" /NCGR_SAMPLE_ID=MMETSP0800 /ASSEMBLY_ACC=CAM_ASM_000638 /LENGTH=467 /DNA_ID=CAMNT_0006586847 /DNA_START=108 /DNA_END=1508 /DNA_ORIENTATION=-